ncbi:MAG TPA: carbamate kinase [Candidatus Limnocylindrales bacterium]
MSGLPGRIVVALGGNALIRRGDRGDIESQRRSAELAARVIVGLADTVPELVITHGNGPQVGFLALEAAAAEPDVPAPPLDVLGAESQGQIGYLLCQALRNAFGTRETARDIAVVLTQMVVAADDTAFGRPTKPVGPVYDEAAARALADERGWAIAPDNQHWRRVVPSPAPRRIVEAGAIRRLVQAGVLVIASGGGGIPVVEEDGSGLRGVEAVIDKDLAAVVLAENVRAEALLLLTDVDGVYRGWGTPERERVAILTVGEAESMLAAGVLPAGSMAPKVRACVQFMRAGGKLAAIGALDDATNVLLGHSGTRFVR